MTVNDKVTLLEIKINTLKETWKKWIEYLRPAILKKMSQMKIGISMFVSRHIEIIGEIVKDGGEAASAAASALKVYNRVTVAQNELLVLKNELKKKSSETDLLHYNYDAVGGKSYTF